MSEMNLNKAGNSTSKWLAAIVALQVVTLIGQWSVAPGASPAMGQVPDADAQRYEMINEIKGTNERLDKLTALLSSGNLQVKVAKADESNGK